MTVDSKLGLTAKDLREKFEQDLFDLQFNCKHPSSKWMAYSWAIGHYWGEVLVCDVCEKILDRRTPIPISGTYDSSAPTRKGEER